MDDLGIITVGLYRIVNNIVGSESIVSLRRMVMDLEHELGKERFKFAQELEAGYLSGSTAEGLRFSSSDVDYMLIFRDVRVIFSLSQFPIYNNRTVLLAESETVRPGFVLLRQVNDTNIREIDGSFVRHDRYNYVASSLWRNQFLFRKGFHTVHGPCTSGEVANKEFDFAVCIKSDIWPISAVGCIRRLENAGWPSREVLTSIVKEGSIFVPIGSKGSPSEECEWRLSFSLAEKSLCHNMSHCQFLVYGLLKIFLKEAIDTKQEIKGLLCSYFLKTILFWKVTEQEEWSEHNFLQNFWKCFQTLLTYVISGYCPNFFIPENNMFRGKIEGAAQRNLLSHLLSLYHTGYKCLLQCPTVHKIVNKIFEQPITISMSLNNEIISRKSRRDIALILDIYTRNICITDNKQISLAFLLRLEFLSRNSSSEIAKVVLKTWMKMLMSDICVETSKYSVRINKKQYQTKQKTASILMSSSFDVGYNRLYLAIVLYMFRDFARAIKILQEAKTRLQHPNIMYPWNLDEDKYRAAGGDTTLLCLMMKTVIAFPVPMRLRTCIPELELEYEAATIHSSDAISIPTLVFANFLLFLCYRNEQNIGESNSVLDELFVLVRYDKGYHIHDIDRAISWQILGICQQMNGDYHGAYQSFNRAMQQKWCPFGTATEFRIRNICSYLAFGN